jgi:hypothetical protein
MVEVGERMFSDEVKSLQNLERTIASNIKETIGVSAKVRLVEPKTIARSEGKAVRVLDNRKPAACTAFSTGCAGAASMWNTCTPSSARAGKTR